jgi:hypothetical protein
MEECNPHISIKYDKHKKKKLEKTYPTPVLSEGERPLKILGTTWSDYFPTLQCTKRVKMNLLIPLNKLKKYTSQLILYKHRKQNF